jgi:dUTP pyrophosphatase
MAQSGNMATIKFRKVTPYAITPVRASKNSAGYDLFSATDRVIIPGGRSSIPTDLKIQMPPGVYGRVAPRSGMSIKSGVNVGGGVIDPDFRGNIHVILFNHGSNNLVIRTGDRIAQIIFEKIEHFAWVEGDNFEATDRGDKGFGSSGTTLSDLQAKQAKLMNQLTSELFQQHPFIEALGRAKLFGEQRV